MSTNPINYEYTEGWSTRLKHLKSGALALSITQAGRVVLPEKPPCPCLDTLNQSLVCGVVVVCAFEKCLTGGRVMLGVPPPVHIFPLRLALGFHLQSLLRNFDLSDILTNKIFDKVASSPSR